MLTHDFKEFAELLNLNQVEYLVVGGYALAAYGHPRYTGDLDFWVGTAPANIDGVDFSQCYQRRLVIKLDGLDLSFIALEDFKTNKRATGRHKDMADLEAVEKINRPLAQ